MAVMSEWEWMDPETQAELVAESVGTGWLFAIDVCCLCHSGFSFNPETVPVLLIDPDTGLPPDVHPAEGGFDRAHKRPVCPECVKHFNEERAKRGLSPAW